MVCSVADCWRTRKEHAYRDSMGGRRRWCRRGNAEMLHHQRRLTLTVIACRSALDGLQVVLLAQHTAVVKRKLLAGAELPFAGIAGETGEVVNTVPRPPHPVRGADAAATLGAPRPEVPAEERTEDENGLSEL